MRSLAITSLKTLAVAAVYLVLTPLLHAVFRFGEVSIEGTPRLPLLALMTVLAVSLLVVAFHRVRDLLPVRGPCAKGIVFTLVFYLVLVFIPSTFGMIGFESGAEWQWLTPKKIGTYFTLLADCGVYSVVGAVMGRLFPSRRSRPLPPAHGLALAMSVGAVVFPLLMLAAMWVTERAFFRPLGLSTVESSLWFSVVFYGPFLLTGIVLPLLHLIVRQTRATRGRAVLATTLVFALLWLPIQNFMVVFGWSFLDPFLFSVVSIVPAALIVAVSEVLFGREGSPAVAVPCA